MAKLSSLMKNMSHPMHDTLTALGSSFSDRRLLHPRRVKEVPRPRPDQPPSQPGGAAEHPPQPGGLPGGTP